MRLPIFIILFNRRVVIYILSSSKICPKCGKKASYNSGFGAYYCASCGFYEEATKHEEAPEVSRNCELASVVC